MGTILQLLISGIAMGFIYALVAIEYTLIWNSTGLLNFSHDKIITVGAYIFAATFIIKFNMNKPCGGNPGSGGPSVVYEFYKNRKGHALCGPE